MSYQVVILNIQNQKPVVPSYAIGFVDQSTNEKIYLRTAVIEQDSGLPREEYQFTDLEQSEKFYSKTRAKKYLRNFRLNFKEEDYQQIVEKPDVKNTSMSCYEIKCASTLFDANEEMMVKQDNELEQLLMNMTMRM